MTRPATPLPGVLESCIYAPNLDAAEGFYGGLLGLEKVTRIGDRHVFFRCGGQMVLVFNPAETKTPPASGSLPVPPHGAEGEGHICFECPDAELAAWRDHLGAAGVAIESEVDWPNGAKSIYVRDPAGNSVEFADRKLWFGES